MKSEFFGGFYCFVKCFFLKRVFGFFLQQPCHRLTQRPTQPCLYLSTLVFLETSCIFDRYDQLCLFGFLSRVCLRIRVLHLSLCVWNH